MSKSFLRECSNGAKLSDGIEILMKMAAKFEVLLLSNDVIVGKERRNNNYAICCGKTNFNNTVHLVF